ncbi:hypothetical protein M8R20_03880 [Pseudomonas sp. R2.Fl]|nr:hypothetical protein [Pseudomonas sp. R2.Fl]
MRHLLLVAIATAGIAAPAAASSIENVVSGGSTNGSIMSVDCRECPPLKPKDESASYKVPRLDAGTQKVELVEQGGERKLLRTEAWMGGSPVLFVSRTPIWDAAPGGTMVAVASEIDHSATTAALTPAAAPDFSSFELRLN